jgi:predicted Rdx family selenoprotein
MYLRKTVNSNGTYGKCSCAILYSFRLGDRVIQTFAANVGAVDLIGRTGTVAYISYLHHEVRVIWHKDAGRCDYVRPQWIRKITR